MLCKIWAREPLVLQYIMSTKYSKLSRSSKNRIIEKIRRHHLISQLELGKVPTLRTYLPGAEEIYLRFNIRPNVDVFVPKNNLSKEIELKQRRRFKYDKYVKPYAHNGLSELTNTIRRINDANLKDRSVALKHR